MKMKMKIKDEIDACRMTMKLWEQIADDMDGEVFSSKAETCTNMFGELKHYCPCCEYAKSISTYKENISYGTMVNCLKCPMSDFWSKEINERQPGCTCELEDSPYNKLGDCYDGSDCYKYVLDVANLAKEALEYWTSMRDMNIVW